MKFKDFVTKKPFVPYSYKYELYWLDLTIFAFSLCGLVINGAAIYAIYKIVRPTRGILAYSGLNLSSTVRNRSAKAFSEPIKKADIHANTNTRTTMAEFSPRRFTEYPYSRKQSQAWIKASGKLTSTKRQITPNLRYVWCLAGVDFFHSLFVLFHSFMNLFLIKEWQNDCVFLISDCLFNTIHCLMLLMLTTIALDLYSGIVHWRWYNQWFLSSKSTLWILGFNTIVSFILGFTQGYLPPVTKFTFFDRQATPCGLRWSNNLYKGRHITFGVILFSAILIAIAYTIAIIYARRLHRNANRMSKNSKLKKRDFSILPPMPTNKTVDSNSSYKEDKFQDKYIKGLATTALLVACFFGSFMPSFASETLVYYMRTNKIVAELATCLAYVPMISSCLNPLLYAFRDQQVRKSFMENLRFLIKQINCCCNNEHELSFWNSRRSPFKEIIYRKYTSPKNNVTSTFGKNRMECDSPIRRKMTHANLEAQTSLLHATNSRLTTNIYSRDLNQNNNYCMQPIREVHKTHYCPPKTDKELADV